MGSSPPPQNIQLWSSNSDPQSIEWSYYFIIKYLLIPYSYIKVIGADTLNQKVSFYLVPYSIASFRNKKAPD